MQSIAKKYMDRPIHPADLAVYWVEYMIRHGTAAHFDIAARDLYFYQTMNLDIMLILSILTLVVFLVLYFIIAHIIKKFNEQKICSKKNN